MMQDRLRKHSECPAPSSLIHPDEGELSQYFTRVQFCNFCGNSMLDPRSFIVEYWRSEQTVYFCWCHSCHNRWEVAEVTRITMIEPEEEE